MGMPENSEGLQPYLLFCAVCNSYVLPMSKHCLRCDRCVHIFCHHEEWVNNCIGDANYRSFVVALGSVTAGTAIIVGSCISIMVRFANGEEIYDWGFEVLGLDVSAQVVPSLVGTLLAINIPLLILELKGLGIHLIAAIQCLTLYEFLVGQHQGWGFDKLTARRDAIRRERAAAAAVSPLPRVTSAVPSLSSSRWPLSAWGRAEGVQAQPAAQSSGVIRKLDLARMMFHGFLLPLHLSALSAIYITLVVGCLAAGALVSAGGVGLLVVQSIACTLDLILCFRMSARLAHFRLESGEGWFLNICASFGVAIAGPYLPLSAVGVFLADAGMLISRSLVGRIRGKGSWPSRVISSVGRQSTRTNNQEEITVGVFKLSNVVSVTMLDFVALKGAVKLGQLLFWVVGVQPDPTTLQVATESGHPDMIAALLWVNPGLNKDRSVDALLKIPDMTKRTAAFRALILTRRGWFSNHAGLCSKLEDMVRKDDLELTYNDLTHPVFQDMEAAWKPWCNARGKAAKLECTLVPVDAANVAAVLATGYDNDPRCCDVIEECLHRAGLAAAAPFVTATSSASSSSAAVSPRPQVIGRTAGCHDVGSLVEVTTSSTRNSLADARLWYLVGGGDQRLVLSAVIWRPVPGKPAPGQSSLPTGKGIEVLFLAESEAVHGARFAADLVRRLERFAHREHFSWLCASAATGDKVVRLLEQRHFKRVVSVAEVGARRLHGPTVWLHSCRPLLPTTVYCTIDDMLMSPFDTFRQGLLEQMFIFRDEAPLYAKLGFHMSREMAAVGVSKRESEFLNTGEVGIADDDEADVAG